MAWSLLISIATLTLVVFCNGCRLSEERECLDQDVTDQCNLNVTPEGASVPFRCNQVLNGDQVRSLVTPPGLVMSDTGTLQLPISILILLYDIDAPEEPVNLADGWMHWIALGTLETDGRVTVMASVGGKEYHGLNPPPGPAHRYQFMIFRYNGRLQDVIVRKKRIDQLCSFMPKNGLQQPLASSQIRFQNR